MRQLRYLGDFLAYLLLSVFAQNVLLDRAIGLDGIIAAIGRRKLLWRLVAVVSVWSAAGSLLTWLLGRYVTGQNAFALLSLVYLALCGGVYFAADRLLLRLSPETHDVWGTVLPHALINAAAVGVPLAVLSAGIPHWYGALGMGLGAGLGLAPAVLIVSNGMDILNQPDMPAAFRGTPALLIYLGILSLGLHVVL